MIIRQFLFVAEQTKSRHNDDLLLFVGGLRSLLMFRIDIRFRQFIQWRA